MEIRLSEDDKRAIINAVVNQLSTHISNAVEQIAENAKVNNRYYTQTELLAYLKIGQPVLEEYKAQGLKYIRKGGRTIEYDINDVHAFKETLKTSDI